MNAYVDAALDLACAAIRTAPNGAQETTLHREAYSIGGLIGHDLSEGEAFAVLIAAARAMPVYGEPWGNLERKVRESLRRGMERPRHASEAASRRRAKAPDDTNRPLALWRNSITIDTARGGLYLVGRGFAPPYPATIRYLPTLSGHSHALIAALGLPDEPEPGLLAVPDAAVRAVHLTKLDPTGARRLQTENAKIIVGRGGLGFPAVVSPINDGLGLLITEGIENALTLGLSLGLGAWAACGHTRMPALADKVPGYVEIVTIVADPEPAARASACELAKRLERRNFKVLVKVMGEVA